MAGVTQTVHAEGGGGSPEAVAVKEVAEDCHESQSRKFREFELPQEAFHGGCEAPGGRQRWHPAARCHGEVKRSWSGPPK